MEISFVVKSLQMIFPLLNPYFLLVLPALTIFVFLPPHPLFRGSLAILGYVRWKICLVRLGSHQALYYSLNIGYTKFHDGIIVYCVSCVTVFKSNPFLSSRWPIEHFDRWFKTPSDSTCFLTFDHKATVPVGIL